MIEKKLQTLLVTLNPQMREKKIKARVRRAGKILARGIKTTDTVKTKVKSAAKEKTAAAPAEA